MLFVDFRHASDKLYIFEPCVDGCVGTAEHLKIVADGDDSAYVFFNSADINTIEESDTIVVLATEHGDVIRSTMERDFQNMSIILTTENDAILEFPGAIINPLCTILQRSPRLIVAPELDLSLNNSRDKMTMIIPNLYISNEYLAGKKEELISRNIRRIVNVTESCSNYFPEDFQYLRIPVADRVGVEIDKYFYEAFTFIEDGLKDGGVLVHCSAGISRSPTIVAAYLMIKYGYTSKYALEILTARRDVVDINFGFACTLMYVFEKKNN